MNNSVIFITSYTKSSPVSSSNSPSYPHLDSTQLNSSPKIVLTNLIIIVSSTLGDLLFLSAVLSAFVLRSYRRRHNLGKLFPPLTSSLEFQNELRDRSVHLINSTFIKEIESMTCLAIYNLRAVVTRSKFLFLFT